ncbi:MAG: M28 family peptidase, partial [Gammaproteobacteria bacterium]|nr:M28 family peptidase [Gammaproteobacteria bacterium]
CALVLLGVLRSFSAPEPLAADAPEVEFSARRSEAILRDLLHDGVPHVAGSPANLVVLKRIISHLESSGYEVDIQSRFHCNPLFGACSPVDNLIAVKPGSAGKNAVLLTAHYDSGWTGPGAADDAAGTAAVLEIARMASDFPPFKNDIIFLLSDSEENGLIGADAFAQHHSLFAKVKVVVNLEARGITGSSALFETGEGNRGIIRMFAKNVTRPVANSLVNEIYKRMPNDTDYTVYKRKGVMGLNFAFSQGVAVYHSAIDDPDHLDIGSLQHHGDNAWSMMKALADRDLDHIISPEDAGYIDVFASRLLHYPSSIVLGLSLVLGVWVLIAIGVVFGKDLRIWQLCWGVLMVPFLLGSIVLGGYLLSFPLGHWPDLHPIEHPYPWTGRLALFGMVLLAVYASLKLFSGRVSPSAMVMLGWGLIFLAGMVLASKLPTAGHLTLIPLAMFAFGSVIDIFRNKSPAPLLMATVLGFTGTVFISFYHYFMLDVVLNFDRSHFKIIPLVFMTLIVLPMLLAFVRSRELSWQPARWLLVAIALACLVHLSLPGFTPHRPRGMTLMYSEVEGSETGHVVLESLVTSFDKDYASGHGFKSVELDDGWSQASVRPARAVHALNLPGVEVKIHSVRHEETGWSHRFVLHAHERLEFLLLVIAKESGLDKAWVDGQLALDTSLESKHQRQADSLRLVNPDKSSFAIRLLTRSPDAISLAVVTWHELPEVLVAPFMRNWPEDAQAMKYGPRARKVQHITLDAR